MVRRNSNRETGSCKMSKVEYSMLCFSKIAIAFCVVPAGQARVSLLLGKQCRSTAHVFVKPASPTGLLPSGLHDGPNVVACVLGYTKACRAKPGVHHRIVLAAGVDKNILHCCIDCIISARHSSRPFKISHTHTTTAGRVRLRSHAIKSPKV